MGIPPSIHPSIVKPNYAEIRVAGVCWSLSQPTGPRRCDTLDKSEWTEWGNEFVKNICIHEQVKGPNKFDALNQKKQRKKE